MRPVVLLTDFGRSDCYVGVLHAVLEREAPGAPRLDLGHDLEPGDVWAACFVLRSAWRYLPDDAVVLAVVDPGVGSGRRAVAARHGGRWIVAPDTGLASAVGAADEAIELDWRRMGIAEPSRTFHGRDLFAPAAAVLSGSDLTAFLGASIEPASLAPCPLPDPVRSEAGLQATVLHVDRFGNVITNTPVAELPEAATLRLPRGASPRRVGTFAEAEGDEVVWYQGSVGLLELAVNRGSAAEATGLARGDTFEITFG